MTTALRGSLVVTDRMRAAAREVREGGHRDAVAKSYGVTKYTLYTWIARVIEAEREERTRKDVAR